MVVLVAPTPQVFIMPHFQICGFNNGPLWWAMRMTHDQNPLLPKKHSTLPKLTSWLQACVMWDWDLRLHQ